MKCIKSWWILFIISLAVTIPFVAPYLSLDPANSRVPISTGSIQFSLLVAHIVSACIALLTGFGQFIDRLRIKAPKVHRYIGRIYVISVFISGILALVYISYIENFSKAISFLVLAVLWLFTCWKGYRSAIRKKYDDHRKWMIRSFGITLVAVSGRLVVPILLLIYYTANGFSLPDGREQMIEEALNVNIWVGMIINFIIIEWVMRKK
ncbi:DUF2306 domain-containing protein [Ornithinibacillus salinisoli]|uniref:DUF2306 domain-containing protein n=1 Tax=Ornithinibacillus salinisoli TaxID=1848459 RepID=A0ABW4W5Z1_9BACI